MMSTDLSTRLRNKREPHQRFKLVKPVKDFRPSPPVYKETLWITHHAKVSLANCTFEIENI